MLERSERLRGKRGVNTDLLERQTYINGQIVELVSGFTPLKDVNVCLNPWKHFHLKMGLF